MAKFLGSLRVRLTAETEDFRKGLTGATKNLQTFQKSVDKFASSMLAQTVSIAALGAGIKKSLDVAQELDRVQNALASSAKIAGQNLDVLNGVVANAQSRFKLSKIAATEFTTEVAKLADQTGGLKDPTETLRAFLDVGAARGKTAAESLELMRQAVKLSDDATTALLNKKPDVVFNAFADSIGKTAAELTSAQKAMAIVNGVMQDGEAARGSYERWLNTTEGLQYQLTQRMTDSSAVIGQAFQPALVAVLPIMGKVSDVISTMAVGIQALVADVQAIPGYMRAATAAMQGNFGLAALEFQAADKQWNETLDKVKASIAAAKVGPTGPLGGRGAPPPNGNGKPTKTTAPKYDEAMELQDVHLQDAIDRAKILEAVEVSRLGTQATLNDRLDLQLGLVDRIYLLQRDAVLQDTRLGDAQRRVALEKLDLEAQRERMQLRMNAAVEKELETSKQIADAEKAKVDAIANGVAGIAGSLMSGNGVSGSQIGSSLGTIASAYLPVLGPFGSMVGGFLGGLFDKDKKGETQQPIVKGLDSVERAQRETITAIQAQTEALLKPESRFMNLPSNFNVPAYNPGPIGGTVVNAGDTVNNVKVSLTVNSNADPEKIKRLVVEGIGEALYDQRRNGVW
jgi:hypothetical protein